LIQGGKDKDAIFGDEKADEIYGQGSTDTCDGSAGSNLVKRCEI